MDNATRLLILAAEDYTGLWDAAFEMTHEPSAEEAARQALKQLVNDGLVRIFTGIDPARTAPVQLQQGQDLEALAPGRQWAVPEEGTKGELVYFAASDKGVSRLHELHWGQGT